MRDMEHKISRAIVHEAVGRKASTIVYGDVRDIANGIDKGKVHNQRISQWNDGKVRSFVEYKAAAGAISVVLQDQRYTSKTCPTVKPPQTARAQLSLPVLPVSGAQRRYRPDQYSVRLQVWRTGQDIGSGAGKVSYPA